MQTNIGDMPLDIFCDYLTDTLEQEFILGHFIIACCVYPVQFRVFDLYIKYWGCGLAPASGDMEGMGNRGMAPNYNKFGNGQALTIHASGNGYFAYD